MYKLFLTFRYLTRKAIVIFPILVVWLCVMMLIIVTGIIGGFGQKMRENLRHLGGDVSVYTNAGAGFPYYEDLQKRIDALPEVEASTPMIRSYGLLNLQQFRVQSPVQVFGVDPEGRAKVSRFHESLFRQYTAPRNAVEDLAAMGLPKTGRELAEQTRERLLVANLAFQDARDAHDKALGAAPPPENFRPTVLHLLAVVGIAVVLGVLVLVLLRRRPLWLRAAAIFLLLSATLAGLIPMALIVWSTPVPHQGNILYFQDRLEAATVAAERVSRTYEAALSLDPGRQYASAQQLTEELVPTKPTFAVTPDVREEFQRRWGAEPPDNGAIIGVDLGPYARDRRGNYDRRPSYDYPRALVTIVPITPRGAALVETAKPEQFVVVDDAKSGAFDVDTMAIYLPFAKAQEMANLQSAGTRGDEDYVPARAHELMIKVRNSNDPVALALATEKINEVVNKYINEKGNDPRFGWELERLLVQTWEQKNARYLGALQMEKTMQTFILGLMSTVVLVVIFLIFYMIVRDKTRDIGIIKAIGGTEEGVVGIFVIYGTFIGVVGGLLGVASGVAFVLHTNEIHEMIYRATGVMIWDRSVYMFDRIPDTVNPWEVVLYFVAAVLSGAIGALIPALVAGSRNPTEAVRYE